jgi:capsular exopolysaccharide synthesis family protein
MPAMNKKVRQTRKEVPVITGKTDFSVSEAYKAARTNLLFTLQNRKGKRIIVTSASPGEGKTTNCCNLGITLAQTHSKVLIIDCDLRKPTIHKCFLRAGIPGLSEYLAGMTDEIIEIVHDTEYPNLYVICGGTIPPNAAELLSSVKMSVLLNSLPEEYDYILLDTPPVNLFADTLALTAMADGVVLVVKKGQTKHPELEHTLASLKFVNAKVLGMVLNGVGQGSYGKKLGYKKYRKYYK